MRILYRRDVLELVNAIVGQEDALKALAVAQALHGLNKVATQVDLGQTDEAAQIAALDVRDQVVGKVEHAQLAQVTDVLDLRDLVGMQIEHVQLGQVLQVANAFNVVLAEHEDAQGRHSMQMANLLDVVVVEVQEDERRQAYQILNLAHVVVLEVQEAQFFFALEQRHVRQVTLVQDQSVGIGVPFGRLAVHDENARNLRQLCEDDLVFVLDAANYTIFE